MATNNPNNEAQRSVLANDSAAFDGQAEIATSVIASTEAADTHINTNTMTSASVASTNSAIKTSKKSVKAEKVGKPIAPMHRLLVMTWLLWLAYRLLVMPVLISIVNPTSPDIVGGIVWYGLWLIPAFILTPAILRGRSPYILLVGSMLTLVYLGASGVTLFIRVYGSGWAEILLYLLDFVLLLSINAWLFLLLKRLPSMNNVVKQPRAR